MTITIARSETHFDSIAGWTIVNQMIHKPDSVIGLSTGDTTVNMHKVAAGIYAQFPFDTSNVTLFGVDEVAMVPADFPITCASQLLNLIVNPIGLPHENFVMPPAVSDDYEAECRKFEWELERRGGVDLQMLGIGTDGHLGMNLPGTPFDTDIWLTPLSGTIEERIRRKNNYPPPKPLGGITLGIRSIMRIRRIVLVAKGAHKAEIVKQAVFGPITTDNPASVLQLHPNCEFLLDPDAGALVKNHKDAYIL